MAASLRIERFLQISMRYLSFFMSSSISFSVSVGGYRSAASFGRTAIEKIIIPMHLKMSADKK